MNIENPYYQITLRNVIGITLFSVLIFVIAGVILVQLDPTIFTPGRALGDRMLWVTFLATGSVIGATAYVVGVRTPMVWGVVGLIRPDAQWILIGVATAAALFFVGERMDALLGFGIIENTRANYADSMTTPMGVFLLIAVMGFILPIPLEIYFRGILFNYLGRLLGFEGAVGFSALIYGLTYFNPAIPIYMAYGIIHGAVLAILYARSGSLWTAIAANGALASLILAKIAWG